MLRLRVLRPGITPEPSKSCCSSSIGGTLTYIGVYGDDLREASRDVHALFHSAGFAAVLNDLLTDGAFGISGLLCGVATCALGVAIGAAYDSSYDMELFAACGFFAGMFICGPIMGRRLVRRRDRLCRVR